MRPPEVIADSGDEQVWRRVAAIDVSKASGMVCTRLPDDQDPGKRVSKVWEVPATTSAILELSDHLRCQQIEQVTMEATSDYWRGFFYVFEAAGLNVALVNARDVKNVPGRPKTDKLDAVWLAKLTERGMLRASFVPPAPIRQLRDYTRLRYDLTREQTRYWNRLEKLLEDALIKISSVASTLDTHSTRLMIEALIAGQRNPQVLADLALGPMRRKRAALIEALNGRFDQHHAELARMLLSNIDSLTNQIDTLSNRIQELIDQMQDSWGVDPDGTTGPEAGKRQDAAVKPVTQRLDAITGISRETAQTIIAEIGLDMTRFPTPAHLASWARLTPKTIQSGTRSRHGKAGKGNPYLKGILGQAVAAAANTQTFIGERYRRLARRTSTKKAIVAVSRSTLAIVWHLLADPTRTYQDLGVDFHNNQLNKTRQTRTHVRSLEHLGFKVTLEPLTPQPQTT